MIEPSHSGGPGTNPEATAALTTQRANDVQTTALSWSQQVRWLSVHRFVAPALAQAQPFPMVGTPAWGALDDVDPRKWAAVLDAAQHWALRVENCQQAYADAGSEISVAANWSQIAQHIRNEREFFAARPWMRRVS